LLVWPAVADADVPLLGVEVAVGATAGAVSPATWIAFDSVTGIDCTSTPRAAAADAGESPRVVEILDAAALAASMVANTTVAVICTDPGCTSTVTSLAGAPVVSAKNDTRSARFEA